jgi:hypothetical protein
VIDSSVGVGVGVVVGVGLGAAAATAAASPVAAAVLDYVFAADGRLAVKIKRMSKLILHRGLSEYYDMRNDSILWPVLFEV